MIRTELVGREPELAALAGGLEAALGGHPRLVLCHGEPGIGKTRLAEELLAFARARGVPGVWGLAGGSDGAPPYWPWRQVLRAVAKTTDLTAIADEHRLTVDLAPLAPDLFGASEEPEVNSGSIEDRFRQFDAMAVLLARLTRQDPLVIVFDDAHWADQPSLLLLRHVARSVRNERLLIVVNYRDTEHMPVGLVAELIREPVTRQIHLGGLAAGDVGLQLASVVGHDVSDAEVTRVHALTGGNPFYVAETGRMLAERRAGVSAPRVTANLREAIDARLTRLSADSVRLLRAASIVGREFSLGVVAAMMDRPVLSCLGPLDEAAGAGLVEVTSVLGEHRFVHALVRDAIEAGLGTPEQVRLHRLAAEAVEEFYGDLLGPHLFDLARHWAVAAVLGDRSRAMGWIERAGEEAMRLHAFEEGARQFRRALEVGASELDKAGRCRLLLALGASLHLSSDVLGGLEACLEASTLAREIGRADLMAEAALAMEPTLLPEADLALRRLCENALAALGSEPKALRARVTARFAEACHYLDDVERARPASEELLAVARECGDPVTEVAALRARQLVCSGPDGLDERAGLAERMLAVGREVANPGAQLWGHLWRIDAALERGDLAGVTREMEATAWRAQEVRGPLARWQLLRSQATLAQAQARFDDARRFGALAYSTLAPTGDPAAPVIQASLLSAMGHHIGHDLEALAANGLTGPTDGRQDFPTAGLVSALAPAWVLTEVGRLRDAAAIYRSLGPAAEWRLSPHCALFGYAFGVAIAIALDATEDVASLRERLSPYRGHHVVSGGGCMGYFGPVELWLGFAAAHLDLLDDAVVDFEHAVKATLASGAAGFQAETQYELAAVLARRASSGDRARARTLVAESARQATNLGMVPIAAKASTLIDRLDAVPSALLTAREREVAALVARGLTNREIAERLYLSERTSQNHVQHILTKLDLANRSQIAVWVTSQKMSMPAE